MTFEEIFAALYLDGKPNVRLPIDEASLAQQARARVEITGLSDEEWNDWVEYRARKLAAYRD